MEILLELLKDYGWQAVVVALLSLALVEVSKLWVRKLIKNANARHVLYTGLSWVYALGFTAALLGILGRIGDLWALYGASYTVTTILGKVCADAGLFAWLEKQIGELWANKTENGQWMKAIKEVGAALGVDVDVLDSVATKIEEEYLPLIKAGAELFFTDNKEELILNMKQKLAGFVKNEKLQETAEALFQKMKDSWKPKQTKQEAKVEELKEKISEKVEEVNNEKDN